MAPERTPVLIVGAGPIGLEVAIALRRSGIDYLHIDSGPIGSTMLWWAPGTRFFSSPERIAIAGIPLATCGQEKATREEYLAYLRQVAGAFRLPVRVGERAVGIRRGDGAAGPEGFQVAVRGNRWAGGVGPGAGEYLAGAVVLAVGDLHRPRRLGVPGEDLSHVSHYLADPHIYFGRRVVIVGGRNSAVEAATRLHRVGAASITLSYRSAEFDPERIKYWLLPEIRHLIRIGRIEFLPRTTVREIRPAEVALEGQGAQGGRRYVPADEVLLLTGYEQDPSLFESAGVALEGQGRAPRYNPRTMETSIPGLYVAGTAAAGTQTRFKLFIENCHIHAERIAAALAGKPPPNEEPAAAAANLAPES